MDLLDDQREETGIPDREEKTDRLEFRTTHEHLGSSRTVPTLVVIAGPMSGAMTIDATTTAGESSNSPTVAMRALTTVMAT